MLLGFSVLLVVGIVAMLVLVLSEGYADSGSSGGGWSFSDLSGSDCGDAGGDCGGDGGGGD